MGRVVLKVVSADICGRWTVRSEASIRVRDERLSAVPSLRAPPSRPSGVAVAEQEQAVRAAVLARSSALGSEAASRPEGRPVSGRVPRVESASRGGVGESPGAKAGLGGGVVVARAEVAAARTPAECEASTAKKAGVFARRATLGPQTGGDCEPGPPSTPAGSASPAGSCRRELVAAVTAARLELARAGGVRRATVEVERPRAAQARRPGRASGRWEPPAPLMGTPTGREVPDAPSAREGEAGSRWRSVDSDCARL